MPHAAFPPQGRAGTGGWTLIELLVVMTLTSLLLAISLPSFESFLQRRRLDGLSAQLISDLQFLRSSTVAQHTGLRLRLQDNSGGSCYLIHTGAADACSCSADGQAQCQAGTELLRMVFVPASSRLAVQGNVNSMRVDPRLGTFSPAGSIEVRNTSGSIGLRHVVNILGRVRLCASAGDWAGVPAC
jgi:type IV fimbrial biogenesis protein FimT